MSSNRACDYGCAAAIGTHAAATGKHTCGYCGAVMSSCKDDDENHFFDICGAELTHDDSTEWKSDGTYHWHECSCGAKSGEAAHSGGTATCAEKAKCGICGTEYGSLDSTNHAGGTEVKDARDAACGEGGYAGDIYCKDCGELLTKGTATEATGDHTYGSWKVVNAATTTDKGKEERTCSACGYVESGDIPMISDVPQTGDESNLLLWGAVMLVSVLGMVALLAESKRRRSTK